MTTNQNPSRDTPLNNELRRSFRVAADRVAVALSFYNSIDFQRETHQQLGFEVACCGHPEPSNWHRYLWAAAWSHARYEASDEGARQIAQSEADSAWFGHTG